VINISSALSEAVATLGVDWNAFPRERPSPPKQSSEIMTDVASSKFPNCDTWRSRLLNYVDEHATEIITDLAELVRIPSVSGSDSEIDIQHLLADRMSTMNLDVDTWQIALDETLAEPDFPGVEVARSEAWGVVGRAPGHGSGPSLMLNAHVDVVPPGDLLSWEGADPFSGRVTGDTVEGRGSCDMKAGLVASLWAVRGLTELKVPLRGDLVLATVVGEEDGGLGTYALLRRGWRADACVIPEPTSLDIAPASAGSASSRKGTEHDQAPARDALGTADSDRDWHDHRWGLGIERAGYSQGRRPDRRRHRRGHRDRPSRARGSRRHRMSGRQLASRPPGVR
jgi:Peptidase family M20/M25/M40